MSDGSKISRWQPGTAPVAVIMISLNEGHNMQEVLENLKGWAQEVFLVDSCSRDETVDIALSYGVHVVQRRFRGFGDQWNFALNELPVTAPWTMKLDPDERLTDELKQHIKKKIKDEKVSGISFNRHLWFMGIPLPIKQKIVRVWRTGKCSFTEIEVNEHPIVDGLVEHIQGKMEHHDSPDLDHWLEKQNRYTTSEAVIAYTKSNLADTPRFFGTALQRRMWLKKNFYRIPGRYVIFFLYLFLLSGTWRAGWVGYAWARLRTDVMRLIEYKRREMEIIGKVPTKRFYGTGTPDERVAQYE
jgi:glycosyltransferase involved in cell wall biosynthesis